MYKALYNYLPIYSSLCGNFYYPQFIDEENEGQAVPLHLITKQHSLKDHAELGNNLNILSSIGPIYCVSGGLSYFH